MDKDGFTGVKSDVETNAALGKINNKASFSLLPFSHSFLESMSLFLTATVNS